MQAVEQRFLDLESCIIAAERRVAAAERLTCTEHACACQPHQLETLFKAQRDDEFLSEVVKEFDCRNSRCPLLRRPNGQMWKSSVKVLLSKCKAIFRLASTSGRVDCGTCVRVLRLVTRLPELQPLAERPLASTFIDALLAAVPPAILALALAPGTDGARLGVAIINRALLGVATDAVADTIANPDADANANTNTRIRMLSAAYTPHANTVYKVLECFIAADMACGACGGEAGSDGVDKDEDKEHDHDECKGARGCKDADEAKGGDAATGNSVFCAALLPPRWAWVRYVCMVLDSHWHWQQAAHSAGQPIPDWVGVVANVNSANGAVGAPGDDMPIAYPPRAHEGTRWLQGSRAAVLQIALILSLADEDEDAGTGGPQAQAQAQHEGQQRAQQHSIAQRRNAGASGGLTQDRLVRELVACGQWKWAESLVESSFEAAGIDLDGDGGINASARDLVNAGGGGGSDATAASEVRDRPGGEALSTFLQRHTGIESSDENEHEHDGSDAGVVGGTERPLQAARKLSLLLLALAHHAQRRVLASRYAQRFGIRHEHAPWFVSDERRANEAQLEKLLDAATPAIPAARGTPALGAVPAPVPDNDGVATSSVSRPKLPPLLARAVRFAGADRKFQRQVLVSMISSAAGHIRASLIQAWSPRGTINSTASKCLDSPLLSRQAHSVVFPAAAQQLLSHVATLHRLWHDNGEIDQVGSGLAQGQAGAEYEISSGGGGQAEARIDPIDGTMLHFLCEARANAVCACRTAALEAVSAASAEDMVARGGGNDDARTEVSENKRYLAPPDDSNIVMVNDGASLRRAALDLLGPAEAAETCASLGDTSTGVETECLNHNASDGNDAQNGGGVTVLGLDAEWPPVLKRASKGSAHAASSPSSSLRRASTLQVASASRAWIFDLFALFGARAAAEAPHVAAAADMLLARVLRSPKILRLGWGWDHDAGVLHQSYPDRDCFAPCADSTSTDAGLVAPADSARVLELAALAAAAAAIERRAIDACVHVETPSHAGATTLRDIIGGDHKVLGDEAEMTGEGMGPNADAQMASGSLASTVQQWLGQPLDKRQQCSAWGQRPLTRAQVRYAALDAQVLVWVHSVCTQTKRAARTVLRTTTERAAAHNNSRQVRPRSCSMLALKTALRLPPIGFVVDANGPVRAARWLRTMGVDVVILRDTNAPADAAGADAAKWEQIALEANPHRVLLAGRVRTARSRTEQQRIGRIAGGGVFTLGSSSEPRRQFEEIVQHFGLTFNPEEFMSRCAVCNGHGFVHVTAEEVARRGAAPAKVVAEVKDFWACRQCEKIYWEGPQFLEAHERFGDAFKLRGDQQWEARVKTQRAQQLLAAHRAATAAAPAAPGTREDEWQQFKFSEARTSRMEAGAWH